jgi:rhodanese-related sulfurtransferase
MANKPQLNDPKKAKEYFEAKMAFTTGPAELNRWINEKDAVINVVDVRRAADYEKGHVPGAVSLPQDRWETLQGLKKDKLNVLYCYSQQCHLAPAAAAIFAAQGYPVMELEGGFNAWTDYGLKVESKQPAGAR